MQLYCTRVPGWKSSGAARISSVLCSGVRASCHRCSPGGKPAVWVKICAMVISCLSAGASMKAPSLSHRQSLPLSMARRASIPTASGLETEARSKRVCSLQRPGVLLNGKPAVGPAEQHLLPAAHQHAGGGKDLLFQRFLDHLIGLRKVRRSLHGGSSFVHSCREIGYSFSGGAQWTISAFSRPSSALRSLGLGFTPTCRAHSSSMFRSLALSP